MPVTSKHPQYVSMESDWEDCRNFYLGEKVVKSLGERYIPKPEECTKGEYLNYVKRAFFFPAMERTVSGLSGAIDRREPTVKLPERLEYLLENVDGNHSSIRQFGKAILDDVFITGRAGILVDRDGDGGNPYLTAYQAEDIINWHEDRDLGLTLVVLRETYFDPCSSDEFVQVEKTRYRVLRLVDGVYRQSLYESSQTPESSYVEVETIIPTKAGKSLNCIPFVFCNIHSITSRVEKPPLLDLVRKNAEHLRVSADYANALYFTGNPILWASGVKRPSTPGARTDPYEPNFKIAIGSSRALFIPREGKIGLLECSGHGVNPNRDRANDIKLEMAVIGARLLENQRAGVEAAETARLRQSGETSTLTNIVVNCSAAIRAALNMLNIWEGGSDGEVNFMLNDDFIETVLNPDILNSLKELVACEYISWDTFYYNLVLGELAVPGRTADEERSLIEAQPPMGYVMGDPSLLEKAPNITQENVDRKQDPEDVKEKEGADAK